MLTVNLKEDLDFPNLQMLRNVDYLCEGQQLATLSMLVDGNLEAYPTNIRKRWHGDPRSILVLRAGGAGDILFLTPALRALCIAHPKAHITVATSGQYHWILAGSNLCHGFSDFPLKHALTGRHDWVIDLENTVELIKDKHVVDIFCEHCHVVAQDKRGIYHPLYTDFSEFPRTGRPRIALQWQATTPVRSYPHNGNLLTQLLKKYEVAILGIPRSFAFVGNEPYLINTTQLGWSWQKAVDFLQTCDAVVAPDSSLTHFAGAMEIPTVALYGSFEAKFRTAYHPSIKVIQATSGCNMAPCFHHGRRGHIFPIGGPCNQHGLCSSLASITPDEVMAAVESIL